MAFLKDNYTQLLHELSGKEITVIAVSKIRPESDILEAYKEGIKDFGENYVQELMSKQTVLPPDIRWHFIGHLQSNKVKYIAQFVHMIHGVDSEKLLTEINKQALKNDRKIQCLLQVHIATEETKFGFDEKEIEAIDPDKFTGIEIAGLMGMATFTDDEQQIRQEFKKLKTLSEKIKPRFKSLQVLSMGMSADYKIAIEEGSNMIRIGSKLFGIRKR